MYTHVTQHRAQREIQLWKPMPHSEAKAKRKEKQIKEDAKKGRPPPLWDFCFCGLPSRSESTGIAAIMEAVLITGENGVEPQAR